jgi:hypothetical protein
VILEADLRGKDRRHGDLLRVGRVYAAVESEGVSESRLGCERGRGVERARVSLMGGLTVSEEVVEEVNSGKRAVSRL